METSPPDHPEPPGMDGTPPSKRPAVPEDPAEHARDFGLRHLDELDYHAAHAMEQFGIPTDRNGMPDHEHGSRHMAFHRDDPNAGGVGPGGRITIGYGILNPELMAHLSEEARKAWARERLRNRLQQAIAHEYEEHEGGSHDYAVEHAPDTALPIIYEARELGRRIRDAERARRTPPDASSPSR